MGTVRTIAEKIYALGVTFGGPGLFVVAASDSSFISVLGGNDLLIVVLSIGESWSRMCYLVLMTIAGSALGCAVLYAVGRRGGTWFCRLDRIRIHASEALYRKYGMGTILVASMLPPPAPFKIFVLSAGFFRVPFAAFLGAVLVGRSVRYFALGVLAVLFGESVREYMQRNLAWTGTVLLVAAVMGVAGYFLIRNRWGRAVGERV